MKLFISYSRLDRSRVGDLISLFRTAGHSVWFDYSLLPGQQWQPVLRDHIKGCNVFVAAISARWLVSEWCQWELAQASTENKSIFPIVLETDLAIPEIFTTLQLADFTDSTTASELNRILGGLAHISSKVSNTSIPDISPLPKGRPSRDLWMEQHKQNSAHMHLGETVSRIKRNKILSIDNSHSTANKLFSGIIGIDFGTSSSLCAIMIDGQPVIIPNRFGNTSTVSAIYINDDGSFSIGEPAVKAALRDPKHAVLQVKRLFGTNVIFRAYGKEYTAPQLAAEIIKTLLEDCNTYLGALCQEAVVTVPAYFTEIQRDDLRISCQLAGVDIKRIVVEPSAACMAFGCYTKREGIVAVFDIGGGTFDISIVEIEVIEGEMQFEVISISGNDKLGGSDYDQTIVDYCIANFMNQTGIDLSNNLVAQMRLRDAAEFSKIELTSSYKTVIHVPMIYADESGSYDLTIPFSVDDFDNLTEHLTSKILDCCKEAVKVFEAIEASAETMNVNYQKKEITNLILVGQASRTPLIRKQAEKFFKCKANLKIEPDKAVAIGAAWQGGVLSGDEKDILLLDVNSHTLGIALKKGEAQIFFDKNTTIPTNYSQNFQTTRNQQTHAFVDVLQGHDTLANNNILLSRLIFSEITPLPVGEAHIKVSFELDANSILEVVIKDIKSGIDQHYFLDQPIFQTLDNDNVVLGELTKISLPNFKS